MPPCASASRSSRCARESGVRSAVACTSTRPPSPVMTTLASTSARGVLGVVEVQQRLAADDPARDRRDAAGQRRARSSLPSSTQPLAGERERHVAARDRRAARAAVGRQHVAVDVDRALAERLEVHHPAQRAADQPLDLDRAAVGLARVMSRCLRSPVEAGSIPYSAVSQPRPWPCIQRGTDSCTEAVQITRVPPQRDQRRAGRGARRSRARSSSAAARRPRGRRCARGRHGRDPASGAGARTVLDLAERQLQEARAERAEALGVARAQEASSRPRPPAASRARASRARARPGARPARRRRRSPPRGRGSAGASARTSG